jgi:GT2 family glycosyltransferase
MKEDIIEKDNKKRELYRPLVSIITVNFNQAKVTCELLESIQNSNYRNIEVIVVDNASKIDPTEIIKSSYPETRVITSSENLGFAGGNNLGIAQAKGEFLFFVNNDTVFTPDLISVVLEEFQKDPDIGVVSPKIRFYQHPDVIQYAGYTPINPYTARNSTIGYLKKDLGQFDRPGATHYAHGAAMMVKRDVIEKVGRMPENFFLYYEELDWCEQIKRAGFKIHFQPKAVIYHKESISVGKASPLKTYYLTRNRVLFMRRNFGTGKFLFFLTFFILCTAPKNIFSFLTNWEKEHIKAFLRALIWNFQRKKIYGNTF